MDIESDQGLRDDCCKCEVLRDQDCLESYEQTIGQIVWFLYMYWIFGSLSVFFFFFYKINFQYAGHILEFEA